MAALRLGVCATGFALVLVACGGGGSGQAPPGVAAQQFAGSATLTWNQVTLNTDGTPLTGLAGYKVYYGTAPDALHSVVVVPAATQTTYVVGNLSPGTWYFAVAAYTGSGIEGELSNVGVKTLD